MAIKLDSLNRWLPLQPGEAVVFDKSSGAGHRRVRLHLNMAQQTTFYVEDKDGARLLATTGPGLECIEFSASGTIAVFADEGSGEVHYHTAEGEPTHARIVDAKVFTRIATRRHRNPELEAMMFTMQQNIERRLKQQAAEFEAAMDRRRKEETDGRPPEAIVSNAPKPVVDPVTEVKPEPVAPAAAEPPEAGSKGKS